MMFRFMQWRSSWHRTVDALCRGAVLTATVLLATIPIVSSAQPIPRSAKPYLRPRLPELPAFVLHDARIGHRRPGTEQHIDDGNDPVDVGAGTFPGKIFSGVPPEIAQHELAIPDPWPIGKFGRCTVTHIGRGFFITAGHCFLETSGRRGQETDICGYVIEMWKGNKPIPVDACRVASFAFTDDEDIAVLSVQKSHVPEQNFAPDYTFDWSKVQGARWVRMFGYANHKMKFQRFCEAQRDPSNPHRILHTCDTDPGDSGSALIDVTTGRIIAVHAGATEVASNGNKKPMNYGFPLSDIPWNHGICSSIESVGRAELSSTKPLSLSVSPNGRSVGLGRVIIQANGDHPNPQSLSFTIWEPNGAQNTRTATISAHAWMWREELIPDPKTPEASWVAEIAVAGTEKGKVDDARFWLCP